MARNDRLAQPSSLDPQTRMLLTGLALLAVAMVSVSAGAWGSWLIGGMKAPQPKANPIDQAAAVVWGRARWDMPATIIAAVTAGLLVGLIGFVVTRRMISGSGRKRVDDTARVLGRGSDIETVSARNAAQAAQRFGMDPKKHPGLVIGRRVGGKDLVLSTWENTAIDIWGTRTGKTTSRAIPTVLAAPGAVLATSNKRDLVDGTRGVREAAGQVWVFDPQGVATEPETWWWNPLSYVTSDVKARTLADHFASGTREPGDKADAFFEPSAKDLLAAYLLAAALDNRPITDVYRWIADGRDRTPATVLAQRGYELMAAQVDAELGAPDKQKQGVYGSARKMISCLTLRSVEPWVNANGPGDARPQFSPEFFVRAGGSLYLLSKEGPGSAGPLVTALTVAVIEAAEEFAAVSPGGRLRTPLVVVLDEAANVCRYSELPAKYSHWGSRGVLPTTILQSWSQGVDVWGESGMKKLWSAANVRVYGGGASEAGFLKDLSELIGDHDVMMGTTSTSSGGGGGSHTSYSGHLQRQRILEPADLAALPPGRAVVMASGARPVLVEPIPWWLGPRKAEVDASLDRFDPGRRKQP